MPLFTLLILTVNVLFLSALTLNWLIAYQQRARAGFLGFVGGFGLLAGCLIVAWGALVSPLPYLCVPWPACLIGNSAFGLLLGLLFMTFLLYAAPASVLLVCFKLLFPAAQAGAPAHFPLAHGVRVVWGSMAGLLIAVVVSTALGKGAGVAWVSLGEPDIPASRPPRATLAEPLPAVSRSVAPDRLVSFNSASPQGAQLVTAYGWTYDIDVWRCRITPLDCWVNAEDWPRSEGEVGVETDNCDPGFWVAPAPAGLIERISTRACTSHAISQTDYVLLADGTLSVWQHAADPAAKDDHPGAALLGPWAGYLVGLALASRADRVAHRAGLNRPHREANQPTPPRGTPRD